MKNKKNSALIMIALMGCIVLTGCMGENMKDRLQKERDSLAELSSTQSLTINELNGTLGEISMMMDSINYQEETLFLTNNDRSEVRNDRNRIKENIKIFNEMLQRQKARIAELEARLNDGSKETANLRKVIQLMKNQIEQKDREIQDLKAQLENSNKNILELRRNVSSLNEINQNQREKISSQEERITSQEEALSAQDKMLNEGYYLVATKKELKDMGIRSGGNLFKKSKMNLSNLPTDRFKKVDIRNFNQLKIQGKKATIVSPAPSSSYSLYKEASGYKLTINDPTAFWSVSNYLVIQTD